MTMEVDRRSRAEKVYGLSQLERTYRLVGSSLRAVKATSRVGGPILRNIILNFLLCSCEHSLYVLTAG